MRRGTGRQHLLEDIDRLVGFSSIREEEHEPFVGAGEPSPLVSNCQRKLQGRTRFPERSIRVPAPGIGHRQELTTERQLWELGHQALELQDATSEERPGKLMMALTLVNQPAPQVQRVGSPLLVEPIGPIHTTRSLSLHDGIDCGQSRVEAAHPELVPKPQTDIEGARLPASAVLYHAVEFAHGSRTVIRPRIPDWTLPGHRAAEPALPAPRRGTTQYVLIFTFPSTIRSSGKMAGRS